jgi:hypothetical protein
MLCTVELKNYKYLPSELSESFKQLLQKWNFEIKNIKDTLFVEIQPLKIEMTMEKLFELNNDFDIYEIKNPNKILVRV